MKNFSIRTWVTSLVIFSITLTLIISIVSAYKVTKGTLIYNTLEENRTYAEKMAKTTEELFSSSKSLLSYYSIEVSANLKSKTSVENELIKMFNSNDYFNSIVYVNEQGFIEATAPKSLNLVGRKLTSEPAKKSLATKEAIVSNPYIATTGRLIVLVSTPVNLNSKYEGFLAGTIYLDDKNALQELLDKHFFDNGSYLYVVDPNGHLIYHPINDRIGENVSRNPIVQKVIIGDHGAQRVVNTKNVDMLAGFSPVTSSGWGIISQTPTEVALKPLSSLLNSMFFIAIPFIIIIILFALWVANRIVSPLKQLSSFSERLCNGSVNETIPEIRIWYKEATNLNKAINIGVNSLHNKINHLQLKAYTDPLTRLSNRRAVNIMIDDWIKDGVTFSLILFDLDNFKKVNDDYGHEMGDKVLQFIAQLMNQTFEGDDLCARYGGEEFLILMPKTDKQKAYLNAEKLRKKTEKNPSPIGKPVTASIGIATYPIDGETPEEIFSKADKAMYEAKQSGKNRTIAG